MASRAALATGGAVAVSALSTSGGTAMTDETLPDQPDAGTATATEDKDEKLHQAVDIKDIGPCKKHIKVTVDRGDIDKLLDEKFSELVKEAHVPGFRQGKAPRKVITRKYHK